MPALNLLADNTDMPIVDRYEILPRPERKAKLSLDYQTDAMKKWFAEMTGDGEQVWHHQAIGLEALANDSNVVLATNTGSGKSLVFQAAVMRRLLDDPEATAFAMYPMKSLAIDQLERWKEAFRSAGLDESRVVEIHGDIHMSERDALLRRGSVIICTPDIVHAWFMPQLSNPLVQNFLRRLTMCVIDEAHNLEGVFGSNCAFLFRRLRAAKARALRLASLPTRHIQFVAASATMANPAGHLEALTGLPFIVIDEADNGAPTQAKTLLHIEGPEHGGVAEATAAEIISSVTAKIAEGAMIAFADGRQMVERIASSIGSDEVEPYRAGFEHVDRIAIAKGMRNGKTRAVVATSALELGIDVPQFTLGLNVGIPGSRKALRQRAGRVGRSEPSAFAVMAEASAFAKLGTTLQDFYDGAPEASPLYLENAIIQFQNACCLLQEAGGAEAQPLLPADIDWPRGFDAAYAMAMPGARRPSEIEHLALSGATGSVHLDSPLRQINGIKYAMRTHRGDGTVLGTIDDAKALREAYPGATYLHRKVPYKVVEWRSTAYERSIYLQPVRAGARTMPILRTKVNVSHQASELQEGHLLTGTQGSLAEVRLQVTESVEGYRTPNANLLYGELSQKDWRLSRKQRNFSTTGVVIRINEPWFVGRNGASADVRNQVGRALATLLAREFGIASSEVRWEHSGIAIYDPAGPRVVDDALVIFDDLSGGLRLTKPLFENFQHFLSKLELGAELAGEEALLDETSVARLADWFGSLASNEANQIDRPQLNAHQRLIFAPKSKVSVRINGNLVERRLLGHKLVDFNGCQHLAYVYESEPGISAMVFHDQIEPTGHDWRQVVWNTNNNTVEEIAA